MVHCIACSKPSSHVVSCFFINIHLVEHAAFDLETAAHCHLDSSTLPTFGPQEVKVRPDAAVWNALIAAAGRAGQLQRAFEALQDMQVRCLVTRFLQIPDLLMGLLVFSVPCLCAIRPALSVCLHLAMEHLLAAQWQSTE